MARARKTLLLQVILFIINLFYKSGLKTPGIGYYNSDTEIIYPRIIKNIKIKD